MPFISDGARYDEKTTNDLCRDRACEQDGAPDLGDANKERGLHKFGACGYGMSYVS